MANLEQHLIALGQPVDDFYAVEFEGLIKWVRPFEIEVAGAQMIGPDEKCQGLRPTLTSTVTPVSANEIIIERNTRLCSSAIYAALDTPVAIRELWAPYRAALWAIRDTYPDPADTIWPTPPA